MGTNLQKPVGFRFDDDELALLDRVAQRFPTKKAAVIAALEALDRGGQEPTPAQALRVLERLVKARAP